MADINVLSETEGGNNWTFAVQVTDGADTHDYTVTLGWRDYDHWSHGRVAPERVVKSAFEFLLGKEPASSILAQFDCSVIRRYFPEVDRELPRML